MVRRADFPDWGITPAWAGKSFLLAFHALIWQDYPRVGGEENFCNWKA